MALEPHLLLISFPAQGHINPSLHFAKRLVNSGVHVTFATTILATRHISKTTSMEGLSFASIADGYDGKFKPSDGPDEHYMSEFKQHGQESLKKLIVSKAESGQPFNGLICSILLPWIVEVAHQLHLPSAILWVQPATVLVMYYHYFNGYDNVIREKLNDAPISSIELPGLPMKLSSGDLPSFLVPSISNGYPFAISIFKEHFANLDKVANPKILVNTFDALEFEALRAIEKYCIVGIGPLVPSAYLDGQDPSDTSSGADLFQSTKEDYLQWLNTKPNGSVVYVSFGSIAMLSKQQAEELSHALVDFDKPFMWVIREEENGGEDKINYIGEMEQKGMIVPWCLQLEVLSHPSVGCFLTHCGWNSILESIVLGVPVVAFPQWADQGPNAKLIEDAWKIGVRVRANEEGFVKGDEIKRCLEMVMGDGDKKEELRRNALKWKDLAREAAKEGGSSHMNLKSFIKELARGCL